MIFESKPSDFNPSMEVVGCFVECDGKILLLLRQDHKNEGNKWCCPGGKVEKRDRSVVAAAARELFEETAIILPDGKLGRITTLFIRYPSFDFIYHIFIAKLDSLPQVKFDGAHKAFAWVTPEEALQMSLVLDEDECIRRYYRRMSG